MVPFHKCSEIDDKEKAYELFKDMFLTVVNRHAPLKTKTIRGTQASFMNKESNSAIIMMHRSKLRNVFRLHLLKHGKPGFYLGLFVWEKVDP